MRRILLFTMLLLCSTVMFAQNDYWSANTDAGRITTDKAVARLSFPSAFKLFNLNAASLRQ